MQVDNKKCDDDRNEYALRESNRQKSRARFRRKYHYYTYLKNWTDLRSNLDYLDNKSLGMLTVSAILVTGFLIFTVEISSHWQNYLGQMMSFVSAVGIVVLLCSVTYALRCHRTLVDFQNSEMKENLIKLEECFRPDEWRVREAGIDAVLGNLDKMSRAVGDEREAYRVKALHAYQDCRQTTKTFADFQSLVRCTFNELRHEVEAEVELRHDHLAKAGQGVTVAIFLFGANAFLVLLAEYRALIFN